MPTIYRHKVKHEQTATFRRLQHSIYAAETSCLLLEQLQHNYDAMLLTIHCKKRRVVLIQFGYLSFLPLLHH